MIGANGRQLLRPGFVLGLTFLATLFVAAIAAPYLAGSDPIEQSLSDSLALPSADHLLGCDKLGRDQFSRLLYGARVSLTVGLAAVALSATIGIAVGATAGYAGGVVDFWLMRVVDVLLAFPGILLAIAFAAILGPGLTNVVIALSLVGWTTYARLVRGEVLSLKARPHVEAAVALGLPSNRIVRSHVLPLLAAPLVVQATFGVASAIVGEASLSFLGLGVQAPQASWGAMVNDGRSFLLVAPHLTIFPGLAIAIAVLGVHLVGEDLRVRFARKGP
ncbi:MAG: ABC transporter permease [Myxococcales bacterium]|nr:MAG: ABC transporter permease [Myxococcales bacterium]